MYLTSRVFAWFQFPDESYFKCDITVIYLEKRRDKYLDNLHHIYASNARYVTQQGKDRFIMTT